MNFRQKLTPCFFALLAYACLCPGEARAQLAELKRVRALLVIDTNSNLKESVSIDKGRMEYLFARGIPRDRFELKTLEGNSVTPENILDFFRTVKTSATEALLFYYAGHGAYDPEKGHCLVMGAKGKEKFLVRSELQKVMEQRKAGLVVLLTDCCSSLLTLPKSAKKNRELDRGIAPTEIKPVLKSLLFQQRGMVDITAAVENTASWGDDDEGGIFTRSLQKLLLSDAAKLDTNKDGLVSWQEFYPRLKKDTENTFGTWASDQRARGQSIDQGTQQPRAFRLDVSPAQSPRTFAVVSFLNETAEPVKYAFRWSSTDAWQEISLAPKGSRFHDKVLTDEKAELPQPEARFGDGVVQHVRVRKWVGLEPNFSVGWVHRFRVPQEKK